MAERQETPLTPYTFIIAHYKDLSNAKTDRQPKITHPNPSRL